MAAVGSDSKGARLRLHVAITAGKVQRMIMGNPRIRLDYSAGGECEMGIQRDAWDMFAKSVTPPFTSKVESEEMFVRIPSETIYTLSSLLAQTANTKRNHRAVHLPSLHSSQFYDLEQSRIVLKFVNQSLVKKLGDSGFRHHQDPSESELSTVRQRHGNSTPLVMDVLPGKVHSKADDRPRNPSTAALMIKLATDPNLKLVLHWFCTIYPWSKQDYTW
ncbi:hypothetical protein HDU76_004200 [Blyttiomyces sp. JEL0837]|nr:hypothetical protein HDU76_004200 [Blyttiomyces sp. JEL0837]